MFKKQVLMLLCMLLVSSMFLAACGVNNQASSEKEGKLLIYTSMYPLYHFASEIAGDLAEVVNLIPAGAEPHDYEPTAKDIIDLSNADMFIYNGGGFESWIEKIIEAVDSDKLVLVNSTANISLLTNEETGHHHHDDEHGHDHDHGHGKEEDHDHDHDHDHEHGKEEDHDHDHDHEHGKEEDHDHDHDHDHEHGKEEDHDHDHDHDHEHGKEEDHDHDHDHDHEHGKEEDHDHDHDHHHHHGEFDPHVWLDPNLAKLQALEIKHALISLDPANQATYEENYQNLAERFDALDAMFEDLEEHITRTDFIVSHAAFGYLANRYHLNQISIAGINPAQEPSPRQLQEIVEFAQEHKIEYILFENMVTPKVAEVVREQVGAEALILHNLEGLTKEELSQGKDYFSIMEENLEVLKKALGYTK